MKKLLSILLVIVMLLSLSPVTLASEEAGEPDGEAAPAAEPAVEPEAGEAPATDGLEHSPGGGFVFRINSREDYHPRAGEIPCSIDDFYAVPDMGYTLTDCYWEYWGGSGHFSRMDHTVFRGHTRYAVRFSIWVSKAGDEFKHVEGSMVYLNDTLISDYNTSFSVYQSNGHNEVLVRVIVGYPAGIEISAVSASGVKAPVAGEHPDFTAEVPKDAHYSVNTVRWIKFTGDGEDYSILNGNSVFETGHTYECSVLLEPDDDYDFSHSMTAELNGSPADVEVTDLPGGSNVASIKYSFPLHDPLTRADFAVLETELTGGEPFPNAFGVPAEGSRWKDAIHFWEDARGDVVSGIPEKGRYYWLNVYIEPYTGYTFGEAGTEVPVYAAGVYVGDGVVENDVYGRAELLHLRLRRTGPAAVIRAAGISLTAPVAGAAIPAKPDGMPDTGSQFIISEQFWSTGMSTSGRLTSGTFTAGTTYYYYVELLPNDGCEFAGTPGRVTADELTVTANGEAAYSVAKSSDGKVTAYIPFKAEGTDYAGNIELTGLIPPIAGVDVSSHASAAESGYAVTDQGWADSIPVLFVTKTKDTVFQAGKMYYWVATVKLTGGRVFPEGYAGTVTVNGAELPYLSAGAKLAAILNGETPEGGWDVNAGTDTMTIAYAYTTHSGVLPGDADGNGTVNRYDAALILRYCAGLVPASALDTDAADVDEDGRVTPNDAAVILH